MHCDEVRVFLGIFQQIAPAQIGVSIAFSKDEFTQEKHVSRLKEPS
jgi:hypothetical protein